MLPEFQARAVLSAAQMSLRVARVAWLVPGPLTAVLMQRNTNVVKRLLAQVYVGLEQRRAFVGRITLWEALAELNLPVTFVGLNKPSEVLAGLKVPLPLAVQMSAALLVAVLSLD
jgi:hypothetical protein